MSWLFVVGTCAKWLTAIGVGLLAAALAGSGVLAVIFGLGLKIFGEGEPTS